VAADLQFVRRVAHASTSFQSVVRPGKHRICTEVTRMRQPSIDDFVRLTQDIPELGLGRDEIGIVRSTWFAPAVAYEVEFHPRGQGHQTRALLLAEQVRVEDGPLFDDNLIGAVGGMSGLDTYDDFTHA